MKKEAQCKKLLRVLKKRPLTKLQILQLGILNGGGRIYDLRERGHDIETRWVERGAHKHKVAQYHLVEARRQQKKRAA